MRLPTSTRSDPDPDCLWTRYRARISARAHRVFALPPGTVSGPVTTIPALAHRVACRIDGSASLTLIHSPRFAYALVSSRSAAVSKSTDTGSGIPGMHAL